MMKIGVMIAALLVGGLCLVAWAAQTTEKKPATVMQIWKCTPGLEKTFPAPDGQKEYRANGKFLCLYVMLIPPGEKEANFDLAGTVVQAFDPDEAKPDPSKFYDPAHILVIQKDAEGKRAMSEAKETIVTVKPNGGTAVWLLFDVPAKTRMSWIMQFDRLPYFKFQVSEP